MPMMLSLLGVDPRGGRPAGVPAMHSSPSAGRFHYEDFSSQQPRF
jgi:hypothetical protein